MREAGGGVVGPAEACPQNMFFKAGTKIGMITNINVDKRAAPLDRSVQCDSYDIKDDGYIDM